MISGSLVSTQPADHQSQLKARASFYISNPNARTLSDDSHSQESFLESLESNPYDLPSPNNDSSSTFLSENSALSEEEFVKVDIEMDPQLWEARNERRYRMSLNHRYHWSREYIVLVVGFSSPHQEDDSVCSALATCTSGRWRRRLYVEACWKFRDPVQCDRSYQIPRPTSCKHAVNHGLRHDLDWMSATCNTECCSTRP